MIDDVVSRSFGALFLGAFLAAILSGMVTMQSIVYFKVYASDLRLIKYLVATIWILDLGHTSLIFVSLWHYLIESFGKNESIQLITPTTAITIAFTAIITFLVHCFFVNRIFKLSKSNWFISIPLVMLALLRLVVACVTTGKMILLKSFDTFFNRYSWSFTLGLALSSSLDLLITGFLCYFLQHSHIDPEYSRMNHIIDALILYSLENGSLTCIGTIGSMICWVAMPRNLIYMGMHFVICKLYANSLLATLNKRKQLQRTPDHGSGNQSPLFVFRRDRGPFAFTDDNRPAKNGVLIEKVVQSVIDSEPSPFIDYLPALSVQGNKTST